MLTKALVTSPDFGKTTPMQMAALVQYLDGLDPAMAERLVTLPDGIQTKTKFIPSIAELAALKAEIEARDAKYRPTPAPSWMTFKDQDVDVPPVERRRQVVQDVLGYDPQRKGIKPPRGPLVPPTAADLEEVRAKSKIPDAPISDALKAQLRDLGYAETLRALGKPVPAWMQP